MEKDAVNLRKTNNKPVSISVYNRVTGRAQAIRNILVAEETKECGTNFTPWTHHPLIVAS
jgi:hypothetical protein